MNKITTGSWSTITVPLGYLSNIDHDLEYKRTVNKLPSDKQGIKHFCKVPWSTLNLDHKGRIFLCNCDGWLPYPVGFIDEFNSIEEIFNSPTAISIQNSIAEKKFSYCVVDSCGVKYKNIDTTPNVISIQVGIDMSCNLSCPSCRERVIMDSSIEYAEIRKKWIDKIILWITSAQDQTFDILIGSNGEPFISKVYLDFMNKIQNLKNIRLHIRTNGSFLKTRLEELSKDFILNIHSIDVSIDAATKLTYEKVRRGGRWENLLDNLSYLASLTHIQKRSSFVVQVANYKEMKQFVYLCEKYDMFPYFTFLSDWGTWHDFNKQCVHIPESPHYNEFKEIISDPIFENQDNLQSIKNDKT
jgi:organic radical activating enzyme